MPPGDAAAEERALAPGGAECGGFCLSSSEPPWHRYEDLPLLLSSNTDMAGPHGRAGSEHAARATSCPCKHPEARPGVINRHA